MKGERIWDGHSVKRKRRIIAESICLLGGTGAAKDPVCGMMVDPKTAPAKSEYKGQTYYFCAPGCKTSFDKDPEKYLGKAS